MNKASIKLLTLFLLINIPALVLGQCSCHSSDDGDRNKHKALVYKLVAFATILVGGGIGVSLPFVGKVVPSLSPERDYFYLIKAFAAGVILATGYIHVLPDAFSDLTSPCLSSTWQNFPFTGLAAMVATIGTLMFESFSTTYHSRVESKNPNDVRDEEKLSVSTHATHGHSPGSVAPLDGGVSTVTRFRIVSKVLELGIIVHSVIIGLSLGASQSPSTIKPLVAALTFHQTFEGMGLGGCLSQAKFRTWSVIVMGAFFTFTTPFGIILGIIITNSYKENSPKALITEGLLNAASSGILIYMALVDLLAADFMSSKMHNNRRLQIGSNIFLLFGAGCMALLAKWA